LKNLVSKGSGERAGAGAFQEFDANLFLVGFRKFVGKAIEAGAALHGEVKARIIPILGIDLEREELDLHPISVVAIFGPNGFQMRSVRSGRVVGIESETTDHVFFGREKNGKKGLHGLGSLILYRIRGKG